MIVDINFDKNQSCYTLDFFLKEISNIVHYRQVITIITCFAYDFDLDPELEIDALEEIVEKTREIEKDKFTVEISDEGIEVSI